MSEFQNILALDTALGGCQAAVVAVDQQAVQSEVMLRGQAEQLVPFANSVMEECGIAYDALDAVICTIGPGAFTGLRIGVSAAKAFEISLAIPLFGITTLQAIALNYAAQNEGVCSVILETKRADFYVQHFESGVAVSEAKALLVEDVEAGIPEDSVLIGDAVARFVEGSERDDWSIQSEFELPDMAHIAQVLREQGVQDDVFTLSPQPVYLRGADVSQPKNKPRAIAQ